MIRLSFSVALASLLFLPSCNPEEKAIAGSLTGTWGLVAVYADPGDGSGAFHPVTSDNLLVLRPDGTMTANFSYCPGQDDDSDGTTGTYSVQDGILQPDCTDLRGLPFVVEGDTLTVSNPMCIEGCGERYVKVSDEATPL